MENNSYESPVTLLNSADRRINHTEAKPDITDRLRSNLRNLQINKINTQIDPFIPQAEPEE